MTRRLTGWETTRLSKHFILLDFLADHAVYRRSLPLPFDEVWNVEHECLARGLCNELLEPLMAAYGPISVADAFWPRKVADCWPNDHRGSRHGKHRWEDGEATTDVALYKQVCIFRTQVDSEKRELAKKLKKAVDSLSAIDDCRDRVISYPNTEFLCVTYKSEGAKKCGKPDPKKKQSLRAHHVRVGRWFNLLDFCRSGLAVEEGIDPVPKIDKDTARDYQRIVEEEVARSFAAALDPMVDELGRISVVRGMETAEFPADEHADMHRWNQPGPWRSVLVLPQEADPNRARKILESCSHVRDVQLSPHASDSWELALVVDKKEYDEYCGLRLMQ